MVLGENFCFGFITDCETIYFVKVLVDPSEDDEDSYSYFITPAYNMKEKGGMYLYTLLSQTPEELGWCNFFQSYREVVYTLEAQLGEGLTASVWKSHNYAIKHFKLTHISTFNQECFIYAIFKNNGVSGVSQLIDKGKDFIVTTPVGVPVDILETSHIKDIVSTLKIIHRIGLVHRDLRLSNFIDVDGHLIIIDWGFANRSGIMSFSGAFRYAPDEILRSEDQSFPYTPKHDLIMFLRVCWVFLRHSSSILKALEKPEDIMNFYSPMRSSKMWNYLECCCDNLDYDCLLNGLLDIFGGD